MKLASKSKICYLSVLVDYQQEKSDPLVRKDLGMLFHKELT